MARSGWICDRLIVGGVLMLLVATPFLFGGAHPPTYTATCSLIFVLGLLWLIKSASLVLESAKFHTEPDLAPLTVPAVALVALLLFIALVFFQWISLPEGVRALLSPRSVSLNTEMTRGLDVRSLDHLAVGQTLSLYPFATKIELAKVASYTALFLLVNANFTTVALQRRLFNVIVLIGGLVSLLGIAQHLSGTTKIYWFWASELGGGPFGPFPNRNDFAAYLNIVIPIAVALLVGDFRSGPQNHRPIVAGLNPRVFDAALAMFTKAMTWVALGLMTTALFMCGSRGGAIGFAISLGVLSIGFWKLRGRPARARMWGMTFAIGLLVLFALVVAGDRLIERFSTLASERQDRLYVWRDSFKAIRDFPLVGSGLGTFIHVFPIYKSNPTTSRFVNHAHNEYVQLLFETGLIGTLVLVIAAGWILGGIVRQVQKTSESVPWRPIGILAGLTAVMAHGLFTLCIRIPANAYLIAVVSALGLAGGSRLENRTAPGRPWLWHVVLGCVVILATGLALPMTWRPFLAGWHLQQVRLMQEAGASLDEALAAARRAVKADPSWGPAHYEVGRLYEALIRPPVPGLDETKTEPFAALAEKTVLNYQRAIAVQPTSADNHRALGSFWSWNPRVPRTRQVIETDAAFKRAIFLAPNAEFQWTDLGEFYENLGQRPRALACFRAAVNIRSRALTRILPFLAGRQATKEEIATVLPAAPEPFLSAAMALLNTRPPREADARWFAEQARKFPSAFEGECAAALANVYLQLGDARAALEWLQACLERRPHEMELRRLLVLSLMRSNQMERAVAESERLVADEPSSVRNHTLRAEALTRKGDVKGAEQAYRRALELEPKDVGLVRVLTTLLKRCGRFEAAIQAAEEFCRANPESSQGYALAAELYLEQSRYGDALTAYDKALLFNPENAGLKKARNEVLKKIGR